MAPFLPRAIPRLSGGGRRFGHLQELRHDPLGLFRRVRAECGEIGIFRMLDRDVALLSGPSAQEHFFRQPDEVLDPQPTSNELMRPDAGTIDLLDFAAELTIYTSSATLIGRPFRESLTREFSRRYFELEVGTDAIGYLHADADIEAFRVRDRARVRLTELVSEVIRERQAMAEPPRDLLGILLSLTDEATQAPRYTPGVITGIPISTMFAGHHTSAGTAAWLLVELLRQPQRYARVASEIDALYADGREVSYQALREIPELENAVKETLRLDPPLIWLPRTSALSHEDGDCFPEPRRFDPDRFAAPREEDVKHPWAYVPFGGGRHRCLGANFALMQQKAVWSVLLRRLELALAAEPDTYADNFAAMVVRPKQPFEVRYRRRAS
jgi:sterol 14-demethylase